MIEKCANTIADWLINCEVVKETDKELYSYAVYSILLSLSPLLLAIGFGIGMGCVGRSVMIIMPFVIIRKFSGGYHTKHAWSCLIWSCLLLVLCMVLSFHIKCGWVLALITVGAAVSLICFSPIDNENRVLTGMWGANKLGIIKYRIKNVKIFLIAIIWLFILDVYLADYRSMAMTLGLKDSFAILPHVQNDFYFNKIMLLGGMIFFANIPFMSGEELYVVLKIGKEKWSQINCCYIVLSGVLLSTLLTVLSLLTILPAISLKNEWGTLYQTFAFSGTAGCVIINASAMSYYSPYALMLNIFLIDALTFAFMGMLLYTLSLFVSKIWSYVIVVVLIFLQSVFGKMGLVLDNFLPFSWISASHWRFGYDRRRPDLIYIYTAFCMLLFLLAVISEWKIKRMDWVSKEEHR